MVLDALLRCKHLVATAALEHHDSASMPVATKSRAKTGETVFVYNTCVRSFAIYRPLEPCKFQIMYASRPRAANASGEEEEEVPNTQPHVPKPSNKGKGEAAAASTPAQAGAISPEPQAAATTAAASAVAAAAAPAGSVSAAAADTDDDEPGVLPADLLAASTVNEVKQMRRSLYSGPGNRRCQVWGLRQKPGTYSN